MTTETYKTRKIRVRAGRGRDFGKTDYWINGQYVGYSTGKSEQQVLEQLRRDVDAVDLRPEAYGDYWQAAQGLRCL